MTTNKNTIIWSVILVVGASFIGAYVWTQSLERGGVVNAPTESPEPSATESPSATPTPGKFPTATKVPLPTGDGRTTFIDEEVPWSLLLADASCELKGEIKFLNSNTYDNQDAIFIYKGIDHPGRNVLWTVTPQDNISVGPNIFNKIPIPNGESLLGISLPDNPVYKRYELTAKIQYGRLVDGNVKVFEKQCQGKTIVVLP